MALTPVVKSQFPNVPDVAGVPKLKRSGTSKISRAILGKIESYLWDRLTAGSRWGIYTKDGKLLVEADTVMEVAYKQQSRISNYPVQAGAFASYNKVATPYEATVILSKGGGLTALGTIGSLLTGGGLAGESERNRGDFLTAIEAAAASLELYHVVTPERTYINANIQSIDYLRSQTNGARRIEVRVNLLEVRETMPRYVKTALASSVQTTITNPQSPTAAPTVSIGRVQIQTPDLGLASGITQSLGL